LNKFITALTVSFDETGTKFLGLIHLLASIASIASIFYIFHETSVDEVDKRLLYFTYLFIALFVISYAGNLIYNYHIIKGKKEIIKSKDELFELEKIKNEEIEKINSEKEIFEQKVQILDNQLTELEDELHKSISIEDLEKLFYNGYITGFRLHKAILKYQLNIYADHLRDTILERAKGCTDEIKAAINDSELKNEDKNFEHTIFKRTEKINSHSEKRQEGIRSRLYGDSTRQICNKIGQILTNYLGQKVGVIVIRTLLTDRNTEFHNESQFEVLGTDEYTSKRQHFNRSKSFKLEDVSPIEDYTKKRDEIGYLYIDSVKTYEEKHGKKFKNSYNPNYPDHYDSILIIPLIREEWKSTKRMPEGYLWVDCRQTNAFDRSFIIMVEALAKLCYAIVSPVTEYEITCLKTKEI